MIVTVLDTTIQATNIVDTNNSTDFVCYHSSNVVDGFDDMIITVDTQVGGVIRRRPHMNVGIVFGYNASLHYDHQGLSSASPSPSSSSNHIDWYHIIGIGVGGVY